MTVRGPFLANKDNADKHTELRWWLVNAFNGEWSRIAKPNPKSQIDAKSIEKKSVVLHV